MEERNVKIIFSASQFGPRSKQARIVLKKGQKAEISFLKNFSCGLFRGFEKKQMAFLKKKFD
jgi:hypothetical protein